MQFQIRISLDRLVFGEQFQNGCLAPDHLVMPKRFWRAKDPVQIIPTPFRPKSQKGQASL